MNWIKHGLIWTPNGSSEWAKTHATCPTPIHLDDGTLRIYLQSRDMRNVGRVGFIDLDPENPTKVINSSKTPVLDIGEPGSFDDNGVFQTSVLKVPDGRLFMYYVGFELCHHIRYRLLTGLAISEDNGLTFHRHKKTPILERSSEEQHFRCGPFVTLDKNLFRMWYVAGSDWESIDGKEMPIYDIRYMESADGFSWPDYGRVVLPVSLAQEHGFGRPYVMQDGNTYRMHYSIRKRNPAGYRLGFALSENGLDWIRKDSEIGIDISASKYDSDAVEYGAEISVGGKTWFLYNGNDFGRDGLCMAERVY